ncbi:MAG: PaaI family thioesterase [Lysobacteraceae bacterium]
MSSPAMPLQDLAAPDGICYGCGPVHPSGLRIKSHWHEDGIHIVAHHTPGAEFTGWPDLVYGGLIAMLVDCHSNWAAMAYHYRAEQRDPSTAPPIHCVTGHLGLDFLKPTPMGRELTLMARVEGDAGRKTRVLCEVICDGIVTARGDSIFVRVDVARLGQQAHAKP